MKRPIITLRSWGTLDSGTWAHILHKIAKGESFGVWHGYHRDIPWCDGKCSLRVKVDKKRKLVCGRLTLEGDGWDDGGDTYTLVFTPTRARVLTRKLHPALYDHIVDRRSV